MKRKSFRVLEYLALLGCLALCVSWFAPRPADAVDEPTPAPVAATTPPQDGRQRFFPQPKRDSTVLKHTPEPRSGLADEVLLLLPLDKGWFGDASPAKHITHSVSVTACPDRRGNAEGAALLNGDGYIECDRPEALNSPQGFTLSAWIRPAIRQEHLNVISKVTPHRDFNLQVDRLGRPVSHIMNGAYEFCYAETPVPLNEWTFVAATYKDRVWKMYLNGGLDNQVKVEREPTWTSAIMTVGALYPGAEGFHGGLDDVRVDGRALSAAEIEKLAQDR